MQLIKTTMMMAGALPPCFKCVWTREENVPVEKKVEKKVTSEKS